MLLTLASKCLNKKLFSKLRNKNLLGDNAYPREPYTLFIKLYKGDRNKTETKKFTIPFFHPSWRRNKQGCL